MTKHKYIHNEPFVLETGEQLKQLEITYHTAGKYSPEKNNVIWICHALTANSDAADWWSEMVGEGKFYNYEEYFIICANMIGSAYGTTNPLAINPDTNEPYYENFPLITIRDLANAHDILRKHLEIKQIHTLIGGSIGAFQVVEWAIMQPEIFTNMIFIASDCKVNPWITAAGETQRMAIRADKTFYSKTPDGGKDGMEVARAIGMLSFRNHSGYNASQQETDVDFLEAGRAASYQRHQGAKFKKRFDAYSYYSLSRTVDTHNVGRHRGGIEAALAKIKAHSLIIAISTDLLFYTNKMEYMNKCIADSTYSCIHSDFGHDGFLLEFEQMKKIIGDFYKSKA